MPESTATSAWKEGTTIPAEYYLDPAHYEVEEAFLAENLWQYVDQASRIPSPGDFFVFEFGRAESILLVRGQSGDVNGFYNVCRHRGSRLCRHDSDPTPQDPRLSVKQLGQSGSSPVFRCPYHAWTYDTEGSLIYAYGMQDDFDPADNGLLPCHVRVAAGQIFVNLSRSDSPPGFQSTVTRLRAMNDKYGIADLKVAAREYYPLEANWKLATENFIECYHCGPAHKSLVKAHNYEEERTDEQKAVHAAAVDKWVPPAAERRAAGIGGYGDVDGELNPGFVTGSIDGKAVAPLLPTRSGWTHETDIATTRWQTGYWQGYDDHVMIARYTPRAHDRTDNEVIWLVHPDAVEGRDYDPVRLKALWHVTTMEDIWLTANNHLGIQSAGYGAGRYATHEGSPARFVKWYMEQFVDAGD
ncbi:MAG TPA: aromatic ring-hydroxylating dioxygenase subunit alpha [Acidobacteriota bacterium]|nr:aromatic ring-hydroxylating dioxygenase subunit alpha [Acidobacteriota bacterium]